MSWFRNQNTLVVKWSTCLSLHCNQQSRHGTGSPESVFICCLPWWAFILKSAAKARYTVENIVVNHLLFVDDACVFYPSISGLQHLNICCDYAAKYEIVFSCN